MQCPRCGRWTDQKVDYCPVCGASLHVHANASAFDDDPETEVLLEDYLDFQDTVVDPVMGFDPNAFTQQPEYAGAKEQYDTWVLGSASSASAKPSGFANDASGQTESFVASSADRAPAASAANRASSGVASGSFTDNAGTSYLPAPAGRGSSISNQNRPFMIAIGAIAAVAIIALGVCLAVALGSSGSKAERVGSGEVGGSLQGSANAAVSKAEEADSYGKEALAEVSGANGATDESDSASGDADSSPTGGGLGNKRASSGGLSNDEAYQLLSDYYKKAGELDRSIAKCASELNAGCDQKSKDERSSKAKAARAVASQVQSAAEGIEAIELPPLNLNEKAWENLCECYECLSKQIDAICDAWDISLKYDDPKKHKDEILAPVKADQGSDGQSTYYTRFKKLYSSISLVK